VLVVVGGVVFSSPTISLIFSKSHLRFPPPHSRPTPTPWPSQSQRQPRPKPPHRRRKTKATLVTAGATCTPDPPRCRPLLQSERPMMTMLLSAAPARGGQSQTTVSPQALRKRPFQSGPPRRKGKAKKLSRPKSSSSRRGTLHYSPEE
jgi:hypothetical protein